jgi:arylsulfatase A-like enzyme
MNVPVILLLISMLLSVPLNAIEPESEVQGQEASQRRPNILWLIGEDLGPELSCYGHPEVWTPHLDQLARDGVRYTRAFTTAPVCSPSRSAFMTGMYQTSIGAHNHRSHRDDGYRLPAGVRVVTDRFRDAGYFTANVVHLTDDADEKFFRGTGKTDWNFHYDGEPFDSNQWEDLKPRQPFFAQVNFSETHRGGAWDQAHLNIEKTADPEKVVFPSYYPDHPITRHDWAQYLNTAMALDKKIGYVLELLERDGLTENTIVIFFGDHGRAMVRGKQWPYDSGLHIPLIIRIPPRLEATKGYEPGSVNGQLIASIDLTATSLSLAGIDPPKLMQGRVFLGDSAAPPRKFVFGGRDRGDETVDRIRTSRDKRYRYIRNYYPERPFLQLNRYKEWTYPVLALMRELYEEGELNEAQARLMAPTRPPEELYDLERDPYEIRNLADSTDHREIKQLLSTALDTWIQETNDQGRIAEPPEIPAFWEARAKRNYEPRPKKTIEID